MNDVDATIAARSRRLKVVAATLAIALAVPWFKAGVLQLLRSDELTSLGSQQVNREVARGLPRHDITDRFGRQLASTVPAYSVYAEPRDVVDVESTAGVLATILDTDRHRLVQRLQGNTGFAWLARRVTPTAALAIGGRGLPGIGILQETRRIYPNGPVAGQLLGTASIDGQGQSGIERARPGHRAR